MPQIAVVLDDQLSPGLTALRGLRRGKDVVLMLEVAEELTRLPFHKKKLAFSLASMRHFAATLRDSGHIVDYVELEDRGNTGAIDTELGRAVIRHKAQGVILTEPDDWRLAASLGQLARSLSVPLEIREDERFLCSRQEFAAWADTRRQLSADDFYRHMRKERRMLLEDDGSPINGDWQVESQASDDLPDEAAETRRFEPDDITRDVLALVGERFANNFGTLDDFHLPVTRGAALAALDEFIDHRLAYFAVNPDAMRKGRPRLLHSGLAPALNAGLLLPHDILERALGAWRHRRVPLAPVERLVRLVLGRREYVRGLYWRHMPDYGRADALPATRALPASYRTGLTEMHCLAQVIGDAMRHGYANDSARLLVAGNFALLAGLRPEAVADWFSTAFVDSCDWQVRPNVLGLALHADGGMMSAAPPATAGTQIDANSDYCADCRYDPTASLGPQACPFNVLYWDFLQRHARRLAERPELAAPYRKLAQMPEGDRRQIAGTAREILATFDAGDRRA